MRRSALFLVVVLLAARLHSQTIEKIPPPGGPFAIGRIGYDWVDQSRPDRYAKERTAHRELMVYFWYPAVKSGSAARAPYLPGARQFDGVPEIQAGMRRGFGEDWTAILSGSLRTHAVENAPVAKAAKPFPVVIFSHGAGNTGFNYSALIEDVVSHGYVVAAIEHTYAAGAVWFPDGRVVRPSDEKPPAGLSSEELRKWRNSRIAEGIDEGAADVRFVLDHMIELDRDPDRFLLAGRVDLKRVAPMGHSAGAEFSARACQLDSRFKACVDLDGGMVPVAALPIFNDGATMKVPLLLLEVYHAESTMGGLSRETIDGYYKTREEQLRACPLGTYAVVLNSAGIAHPSFSDRPLHFAGQPEYPQRSAALHHLALIQSFVRDFLARNLKDEKAPLLDAGSSPLPESTVQTYGR
jgi:dienelactone hydrolase